jgi:hypothetical protein
VYRFKLSFSRRTRVFRVGSCVHLREAYEELCRLAPGGHGDFFPGYREKDTN